MWKILLAELKYNWVQILISVILMTMPLNILISLYENGIVNDLETSNVLNKELVMYITTAIMFGAMFTMLPILAKYFVSFRTKSGVSIRSMLPLTPLQFSLSHILPIVATSVFLVAFFAISLIAFCSENVIVPITSQITMYGIGIAGVTNPIINLITVNGLWLTMVFILLMWVEYGRIHTWVRNTGIAFHSAVALLMILAGKFEIEFVVDLFKFFFKSLFLPYSAGAYSLLALFVIVTYIVMFTRRKSFLS